MSGLDSLENISLLWPDKEKRDRIVKKRKLSDESYGDINLERIVAEFAVDKPYTTYVKNILTEMCDDIEVINYRQDILEDILNSSQIQEALEKIYSIASEVERSTLPESLDSPEILKLARSFRETDMFGNCLNRVRKILQQCGDNFKSKGLCKLKNEIMELSERFIQGYGENIPEPNDNYSKPASITLGINLDNQLRPTEATIVSLNDQKFTRAPFLNRLIQKNKSEFESVFDFHSPNEGFLSEKVIKELQDASESMVRIDSTALQLSLISDLDRIVKHAINPLKYIIRRYTNTYTGFFINLKFELLYILGAVGIVRKLRALGLPMCRPRIAKIEEKIFTVEGLYNINLALNWNGNEINEIVKNDLTFTEDASIFVLTGPNSGGKTTYINAVSQIQILAQAGMYVPGTSATISPVDNVYTHFSAEEKRDTDYGRLGEEAKRLNEIFKQATEYSLIVLNESLASTSPSECLYMSRDILYGLKLLNAHAIFATHQHELASNLEEINSSYPGKGNFSSLVAGSERQKSISSDSTGDCFKRTYKVKKAPPLGTSYAKDIAESFGISYEQIKKLLSVRFEEQ
jgi:DNA mismatch repair protein MutS